MKIRANKSGYTKLQDELVMFAIKHGPNHIIPQTIIDQTAYAEEHVRHYLPKRLHKGTKSHFYSYFIGSPDTIHITIERGATMWFLTGLNVMSGTFHFTPRCEIIPAAKEFLEKQIIEQVSSMN